MTEINLFLDKMGHWVTNNEIFSKLYQIGADKCDVLFIHSSLMDFGMPNPNLKRSVLLGELYNIVMSLGVRNVLWPTFTFSFCNKQDYDVLKSASKMGALNEWARKNGGGAIRSLDPLMSVTLIGEDKELVLNIGHESCGACSTYDMLHHRSDVKFLFVGPKIGSCMTYMHYLEWLYSVDYRYDRTFHGRIIKDDKIYEDDYVLFSRYKGVTPSDGTFEFENRMYKNGTAQRIECGDAGLSIVSAEKADIEYKKCLDENPYFFVDIEGGKLIKDKTFITTGEVVAM